MLCSSRIKMCIKGSWERKHTPGNTQRIEMISGITDQFGCYVSNRDQVGSRTSRDRHRKHTKGCRQYIGLARSKKHLVVCRYRVKVGAGDRDRTTYVSCIWGKGIDDGCVALRMRLVQPNQQEGENE